MTNPHGTFDSPAVHREGLIEDCRRAIEAVERSLELPPNQLQDGVRAAKRAVVAMRDHLIEALRRMESPSQREPLQLILNEVNTALSLMIGVEYPAARVQRDPVEQARDLLQALLDAKLTPTGPEPANH